MIWRKRRLIANSNLAAATKMKNELAVKVAVKTKMQSVNRKIWYTSIFIRNYQGRLNGVKISRLILAYFFLFFSFHYVSQV